ncbi:ABC-2 type transport system permease protein [Haloactinopolyspora alba]|uniref:ABC-2 type transport system permease protein n=1 Tax=Haloactinopolyspora alba TaxID=648780 RepID=A0A2P8DYU7_9ACTN|nr:ABC transporter permease [Haloactinopolyspora alba]PSL02392.1 ABC-2 type transport system permease protein [Haloactinopolyspora alba]
MNATVVGLTGRALFGGRRVLLLLTMSLVLVALASVLRLTVGVDHEVTADFLGSVAIGALVPLFGLIVGTGVISPEIDDGSIVYLLSKPLPRPTIVLSKLVVAVSATVVFATVPTFVAGVVMSGGTGQIALGYAAAALVASVAYSAIFLLLAVVTKHAVVYGLAYALIWEGLIGGYVPGARTLSVQQWALSVTESVARPGTVSSDVALGTALVLLVVATVAATWYAGRRLRVLTLATED